MATKRYLSLERLTEYDSLIKSEITNGDDAILISAKDYTDTTVNNMELITIDDIDTICGSSIVFASEVTY